MCTVTKVAEAFVLLPVNTVTVVIGCMLTEFAQLTLQSSEISLYDANDL